MLGSLNSSEQALLSAARQGQLCKLKPTPPIRAFVLRNLILRIVPPLDPAEVDSFCSRGVSRWSIEGASFSGRIDLSEGRMPEGGPIPALEFINCNFHGGFKANGAMLERLTIRSCLFWPDDTHIEPAGSIQSGSLIDRTPISLRNTRISADLRLLQLRPLTAPEVEREADDQASFIWPPTSVTHSAEDKTTSAMNEVVLEGHENMTDQPLRTDSQRPDELMAANEAAGGLREGGLAEPSGEIQSKTEAIEHTRFPLWIDATGLQASSVTLNDVDLQAPASQEVGEDGYGRYALDLNSSVIDGSIWLQPRVRAQGGIRLRSARIAGDIWANGLVADDGETAETRKSLANPRSAFNAQGATIGGTLALGATFPVGSETKDQPRLRAPARFTGLVRLSLMTVKGAVYLEGIQAAGKEPLDMSRSTIGGDVIVSVLELKFTRTFPNLPAGLYLHQTHISGRLELAGHIRYLFAEDCTVDGNTSISGYFQSIRARNSTFKSDVTLSPMISDTHPSGWVDGPSAVDLSGCHVIGRLDLSVLRFANARRPRLLESVQDEIRPHLVLRGVTVDGTLSAYRKSIANQYEIRFARSRRLYCAPGVRLWEVALRRTILANKRSVTEREPSEWESWNSHQGSHEYAIMMCLVKVTRSKDDRQGGLRKRPGLVDGTVELLSSFIPTINTDDDDVIKDYVRLFAACRFSADGGLAIAEKQDDLPESLRGRFELFPMRVSRNPDDSSQKRVEALLRGNGAVDEVQIDFADGRLVRATLKQMVDAEKTSDARLNETRLYNPPFRYGSDLERSDYGPLNDRPLAVANVRRFETQVPDWRKLIAVQPERFEGVVVDLRNAACKTLEDCGGLSWSGAILRLEGFTYKTIRSTPNDALELARWRPDLRDRIFTELRRLASVRRSNLRLAQQICTEASQEKVPFRSQPRKGSLRSRRKLLQKQVFKLLKQQPAALALAQTHLRLMEEAEYEFSHDYSARSLVRMTGIYSKSTGRLQRFRSMTKWWRLRAWDFLSHDGAGYEIATSDPLYARRAWLNQRDSRDAFRAQPYTQLASVYRSGGDEESARDIEKERIRLLTFTRVQELRERRPFVASWLSLWNVLYSRLFGYGLGIMRAAVTLVLFWMIGTTAVVVAQKYNLFHSSKGSAMTVVRFAAASAKSHEELLRKPIEPKPTPDCGQDINKSLSSQKKLLKSRASIGEKETIDRTITQPLPTAYDTQMQADEAPCAEPVNPFLYAVEAFTPLLNLHQHSGCELGAPLHMSNRTRSLGFTVQVIAAIYETIGYIVTSLAIITFSGIARRWEQK